MASRFWVGGTGNWSDTAHWAASTGGAGGQSVPTNADDVRFDGSSGSGIVTSDIANPVCATLDFTGYTGTFDVNAKTITIGSNSLTNSNLTLAAGMTLLATGGGQMQSVIGAFGGTFAVTTAGKSMPSFNLSGNGGTVVLQDAYVNGSSILVNASCGFNTNNQTCSFSSLLATANVVRTITFGTSQVTITGSGNPALDFSGIGLAVSAASSTLIISAAAKIITGAKTFGVITINATACYMSAGLTCTTLTINGTAIKTFLFDFDTAWTVTGTLSILANSATNRIRFGGHTLASQVQVTAAALVCTGVVDFSDCKGAGTATWSAVASGATAFGDAGGNSTITFDVAVQQTWQGTSGGNWSDITKWTSRVPLPQDDVVVSSAFIAAQTIIADIPRLGKNISFAGTSGSPTFQYGPANMDNYGSWNFTGIGAVTTGGNATALHFRGRSATYSLTTGGVSLPSGGGNDLNIEMPTATLNLQDNLVIACTFTFVGGTLNTNNFNLSAYGFQFNAALACTVNMGSSTFSCVGATGIWQVTGGVTLNSGTSTVDYPISPGTNVQQFQGGGNSYNIIRNINTGTGSFTITGNNTYNILDIETSAGRTITFPASGTQTINKLLVLMAYTNQIVAAVSSTPGTATTITFAASALPQMWRYTLTDITVNYPTKIRFWVGGPGNWNSSNTANWSTASGGASGASVPDATTIVVFDSNSGFTSGAQPNGVITITTGAGIVALGLAIGGFSGKNAQWRIANAAYTINGNISIMGLDDVTPCFLASNVPGEQRTLTVAGSHLLHKWAHFTDIAIAGAAGTLSGTLIGDCLGNNNITFEPSVTQTWQGTVSGNWSDPTKWSSRVPLPQDNVIINRGFAGGQTITLDMSRLGRDIDFTGTTGNPAFSKSGAAGANQIMFGSLTSTGSITMPGGNTFVFSGRGQHTWTPLNMGWGFSILIRAPGGTYKMAGSMTQAASGTFAVDAGTWDWNGYNMNIRSAGSVSSNSNVVGNGATLILGSGIHRLGGNASGSNLNISNSNSFLVGNNGGTCIFQSQGTNLNLISSTPGANIDLSKETFVIYDSTPTGPGLTFSTTTNVHVGAIVYRGPSRGNIGIFAINLTVDTLDIESGGTLSLTAGKTYTFNNIIMRGWAAGNESVAAGLNVVSSAPGTSVAVNITGIRELNNVTFSSDILVNMTGNAGYQKSPNSFDYFNNPGYDAVQQNVLTPFYFFTGEVFGAVMAPTKSTWNFDYFLPSGDAVSALVRYGLAYQEANAIRSASNLAITDIAAFVDPGTIRSKGTFSPVEAFQGIDIGTIRTPSKFSIADIQQFLDTGTIRSKSVPSILDVAAFIDAGTVHAASRLAVADITANFDAATIRAITSILLTDTIGDVDAATIRTIAQLSIIQQMPLALLSAILWARWSDSSFYSKWSANCNSIL